MLGQDLVAHLRPRHEVLGIDIQEADITDRQQAAEAVLSRRPEVVTHTAAFTAVDECEQEPDLSFRVNGGGTRNIALACREARLPLVYISTDYVFDGTKTEPYVEDDAPNPLSVYGESKLQGEQQVREMLSHYWIVRTSWLFGPLGKILFARFWNERGGETRCASSTIRLEHPPIRWTLPRSWRLSWNTRPPAFITPLTRAIAPGSSLLKKSCGRER